MRHSGYQPTEQGRKGAPPDVGSSVSKTEDLPNCVTHHICKCLDVRMKQLQRRNADLEKLTKLVHELKAEEFQNGGRVVVDRPAWKAVIEQLNVLEAG